MGDWFFGKRENAEQAKKKKLEEEAQADLRRFLETQRQSQTRYRRQTAEVEPPRPAAAAPAAPAPAAPATLQYNQSLQQQQPPSTRDRSQGWDDYRRAIYQDEQPPNARKTWEQDRVTQQRPPPDVSYQRNDGYADRPPYDSRGPPPAGSGDGGWNQRRGDDARAYYQHGPPSDGRWNQYRGQEQIPGLGSDYQQPRGQQAPPPNPSYLDRDGYPPPPPANVNKSGTYGTPMPPAQEVEDTQAKNAKLAQQKNYLHDLEMQVQLKKQKQQEEKDRLRKEDEKKMKEIMDYNPFGRGGGGAPVRNADGSIIAHHDAVSKQDADLPKARAPVPSGQAGMMPPSNMQQQDGSVAGNMMMPNGMAPAGLPFAAGVMPGYNPAMGYPMAHPAMMQFPPFPQMGMGMPYANIAGYAGAMFPPYSAPAQAFPGVVMPTAPAVAMAAPAPPVEVASAQADVTHLRGVVDASKLPAWQQEEISRKHQTQNSIQNALRQQILEKEKKKQEEEAKQREADMREQERLKAEQDLLNKRYAHELEEQRLQAEADKEAKENEAAGKKAATKPIPESAEEALLRAQAEGEALKRKNKRRHVENTAGDAGAAAPPPAAHAAAPRAPSPAIPTLQPNRQQQQQPSPPLPTMRKPDPVPARQPSPVVPAVRKQQLSDANPPPEHEQHATHQPVPPAEAPQRRVLVLDNGQQRTTPQSRRRRASAVAIPAANPRNPATQSVLEQLCALKSDLDAEQRQVELDLAQRNAAILRSQAAAPAGRPALGTHNSVIPPIRNPAPLAPAASAVRPANVILGESNTALAAPTKSRSTWAVRPPSAASSVNIDVMERLNETRLRRLNALETLGQAPKIPSDGSTALPSNSGFYRTDAARPPSALVP